MLHLTSTGVLAVVVTSIAFLSGCADEAGAPGESGTEQSSKWDAAPVEDYAYPVEMLPNEAPSAEGRHYARGELAEYNSTEYGTIPPTSGKHIGELAMPGVYDGIPVPNEVAVHNMEHGYVIVWYNCNAAPMLEPEACSELLTTLTAFGEPLVAQNRNVVITPHSTMEPRLALTAWQFMDKLDEFDEERIMAFIDTFECHYDPEETCG
jgi:hypothetical protein